MASIADLVHQTSTSTGTGNLTLSSVNGKQTFNGAFGNGVTTNVFYYFVSNQGAAEYEWGTGHMSDATTLVRDTVLGGSNGTSAVNFSAGTKDVNNDIPASYQLGATANVRRNRIVNGAMQISQENANTSGTTDAYYVADQFSVHRVTSAGLITAQRVQSVTPAGAIDRARITITTADSSLAAGEYLYLRSRVEGANVADFLYGTASARPAVLRFLFKGPLGTYAVSITNSAANRSYVATFSPTAANTDEIITLVIPGDTSGTWLSDTGIGLELRIVLACGTTFHGAPGWQAGNILGTSGVSNGMSAVSSVFEIGELGLYLDAGETGIAPEWELPSFHDDLQRCQRYWCKSFPYATPPAEGVASSAWYAGFAWSTVNLSTGAIRFPVPMRTKPALTFYKPSRIVGTNGKWQWYDGTSAYQDSSSTEIVDDTYTQTTEEVFVATLTVSGATTKSVYIVLGNWVASARL